jgi:hypothetical protein
MSKVMPKGMANPEIRRRGEAALDAVWNTMDTPQKRATMLEQDPVNALSLASIPFTAGAGALKLSAKGAKLAGAGKTAQTLEGASKVADVSAQALNALGIPAISLLLQGTGKVGKAAYRVGESFFPSGQAAIKSRGYVDAFNGDLDKMSKAIEMLQQGVPIENVAVALNSPGFAGFAKTSQDANTVVKELWLARANELKALQTNQLAGAAEDVNALRQANLPASTASITQPGQRGWLEFFG